MIVGGLGWATKVQGLPPGSVVLVLEGDPFEGRRAGLEVRDSLLIAGAEGISVVMVFRVPIEESTVVAQVLKTGTGALYIDGCRIMTSKDDAEAMLRCNSSGSGRMYASSSPIGTFTRSSSSGALDTSKGRWPTNLVFIHREACVRSGVRKVRGDARQGGGTRPGGFGDVGAAKGAGQPNAPGHAAPDGLETVSTWECAHGCLVAALDEQSGDRRSAGLYPTSYSHSEGYHGRIGLVQGPLYEDVGGASRFYPQHTDESELRQWLTRLVQGPEG